MDDMPVNSFKNYFLSWAPEPSELGRPCYLSIANLLEDDIRSGRLAPGTKLPPQRELADYLDINFSTVTRAYNLCRERRLIYGSTGKGTFVSPLPGVPGDESSSNLIELGVVNGFDNVSKQIIEATEAVLSKGYVEKLYSHTSALGHKHQRVAAMNWMRKFNVSADEEHTVLFSGSQNAISAALLSLFKLGDVIAVDVFTYANLIGTAKLAHIRLLPVAGDAGGMIPEALDECCRKNRVSGIFLMPNCANPTGITLGDERKRALAEVIRKYGLILIEDDTAPALPAPGYISLYSLLPEQTMYICGNLRSLCGGLRVTAAAFPEKFRNYLLIFLCGRHMMMPPRFVFHNGSAVALYCVCNHHGGLSLYRLCLLKRRIKLPVVVTVYADDVPIEACKTVRKTFMGHHILSTAGNL